MKYIKKLGVSKKNPSDDEKATFIKFLIQSVKNPQNTSVQPEDKVESSFSEAQSLVDGGSTALPGGRSKSKSKLLRAFGKKKTQTTPSASRPTSNNEDSSSQIARAVNNSVKDKRQSDVFELREDMSYKKKKKKSWLKSKLKFGRSNRAGT